MTSLSRYETHHLTESRRFVENGFADVTSHLHTTHEFGRDDLCEKTCDSYIVINCQYVERASSPAIGTSEVSALSCVQEPR